MTATETIEPLERIYQIQQTDELSQKRCLVVGLFSMKDKHILEQINSVKEIIEANYGILVGTMTQRRGISRAKKVGGSKKLHTPMNGATYIGRGKAEELAQLANKTNTDIIIFMNKLSGGQKRNLNDLTGCKLIECDILKTKEISTI